jgi:hypothetical protein
MESVRRDTFDVFPHGASRHILKAPKNVVLRLLDSVEQVPSFGERDGAVDLVRRRRFFSAER